MTITQALWSTDGTEAGTHIVKQNSFIDFNYYKEAFGENFWYYSYVSSGARFIYQKFVCYDKLYFRATTENSGEEIWISDGTTNGTKVLKDIVAGPEGGGFSGFPDFVPFNGKTHFVASDVLGYPSNYELWVTDGTENGTHVLKDIAPNASSFPDNAVALSDRLLFL